MYLFQTAKQMTIDNNVHCEPKPEEWDTEGIAVSGDEIETVAAATDEEWTADDLGHVTAPQEGDIEQDVVPGDVTEMVAA